MIGVGAAPRKKFPEIFGADVENVVTAPSQV